MKVWHAIILLGLWAFHLWVQDSRSIRKAYIAGCTMEGRGEDQARWLDKACESDFESWKYNGYQSVSPTPLPEAEAE